MKSSVPRPYPKCRLPSTRLSRGPRMIGRIDRLVLSPERAFIVDIKTDAVRPSSLGDLPVGYLRQLGAYRSAIASSFPGRAIYLALLWTTGPHLMPIPEEKAREAFLAIPPGLRSAT